MGPIAQSGFPSNQLIGTVKPNEESARLKKSFPISNCDLLLSDHFDFGSAFHMDRKGTPAFLCPERFIFYEFRDLVYEYSNQGHQFARF